MAPMPCTRSFTRQALAGKISRACVCASAAATGCRWSCIAPSTTLTGLELSEQCGMTETGMYALTPPFGRKKPGSIGLPFYGVQVCLVDAQGNDVLAGQTGEVIVHSPFMTEGYWNDTAQTRKALRDGWCRTGDLARFDEDGYLWFVGRQKNIIVHDGANIGPAEVEDALLAHPAVAEACVVGVTDAVHGQNVHGLRHVAPGATRPRGGAAALCRGEALAADGAGTNSHRRGDAAHRHGQDRPGPAEVAGGGRDDDLNDRA